jgi:tyrosinase
MALRQNQKSLTDFEKQKFVKAVLDLKAEKTGNTNTYDKYVQWHKDTVDDATGREDAHMGPALFAWHREFLMRFEKDLQRISNNESLGLPYWDWSVDRYPDSSIWGSGFLGGDGSSDAKFPGKVMDGPFAYDKSDDKGNRQWPLNVFPPDDPHEQYPYLRRQFGKDPDATTLPIAADVKAALNATPFDVAPWNKSSQSGFRNRAEGYIPEAGRPHMTMPYTIGSVDR